MENDDDQLTDSEIAIINVVRTHDYQTGPLKIDLVETPSFRMLRTNDDGLEDPTDIAGQKFAIYRRSPIRRPPKLEVVATAPADEPSPSAA